MRHGLYLIVVLLALSQPLFPEVSTCPMSSATVTQAGDGAAVAWETASRVYAARVDPGTLKLLKERLGTNEISERHSLSQ
jgi:hypothetical protein